MLESEEATLEEPDLLLPEPDLPDFELEEEVEFVFEVEALGVEEDLLLPVFLLDDPSELEEELFRVPEEALLPFRLASEEPIRPEPEEPLPMLVVEPVMPDAPTPVIKASEEELLPVVLPEDFFELEVLSLEPIIESDGLFC